MSTDPELDCLEPNLDQSSESTLKNKALPIKTKEVHLQCSN